MIFFSAHGVPVSYVEDAGDPYRDQMEECISLIMQELKARGINNDHTLAYQVGFRIQAFKSYFDFIHGSCLYFPFFGWVENYHKFTIVVTFMGRVGFQLFYHLN